MQSNVVRYFEFTVQLVSSLLLFLTFFSITLFFKIKVNPLYSFYSQIGLFFIMLGFFVRFKAFATSKYYSVLKVTGVYAIVRQPVFLASVLILIGMNIIIANLIFLSMSVVLLYIIDIRNIMRYERLLKRHYKEIYKVYIAQTYLFLPVPIRFSDVFKGRRKLNLLEDRNTMTLFFLFYLFLLYISVLSKLQS